MFFPTKLMPLLLVLPLLLDSSVDSTPTPPPRVRRQYYPSYQYPSYQYPSYQYPSSYQQPSSSYYSQPSSSYYSQPSSSYYSQPSYQYPAYQQPSSQYPSYQYPSYQYPSYQYPSYQYPSSYSYPSYQYPYQYPTAPAPSLFGGLPETNYPGQRRGYAIGSPGAQLYLWCADCF
uniref:Uncharacterized protein n=1 Tax=Plectus sambesii TaxID=2011161 RepID=A0A914WZU7_9BILA